MAKIFSLPINPKLSEKQFIEFVEFCDKYKDYISDLYFTCRIHPFTQDAMGAVFREEDRDIVFENAMIIQKALGIKISATFNNINVSPKYENYKLFVDNLKLFKFFETATATGCANNGKEAASIETT